MSDEQERTMYVGNLHEDASEAILYELFLQAGPLQRISRPRDRESGKLKNFAFIVFSHSVSVPYAIHLTNGIKLFGRPLKSQQRNNIDLPHYGTVGVHSIKCEAALQRCLDGEADETSSTELSDRSRPRSSGSERYSNSSSHRGNRSHSGSRFTPKLLDPNQTWKNNIHHHERQQQQALVSNVTLGQNMPGMLPTSVRQQGGGKQHWNTSNPSGAMSASHYHNLNSQILTSMQQGSSGSDVKSRLGSGGNYRSTRDNYTCQSNNSYSSSNSSGYGSNSSYDGGYNSRHDGNRHNQDHSKRNDRSRSGGYRDKWGSGGGRGKGTGHGYSNYRR